MERPWGLSGPEFLELYWIVLALCVVWAIAVRVRLRGTRGGAPAGALGPYEIAFLTGGPRRVVETAIAALVASGALRPARNGSVSVVGNPVVTDPVERSVLADATRYRYRTLTLLIMSVSEKDAPREVGDRLADRGYLVTPQAAKRWLAVGVLPMALLFAVGVVRWVNGLAIGAPVGWLTLQLVLTGVLIWLLRKTNGRTPTALGNAAVSSARTGGTGGRGVAGQADEVWSVALGGFDAHPNIPLRAAARPHPRSRAGRGARTGVAGGYIAAGSTCSSGSSSCGGSSSSCGSSGSSCGGGGGGCGGGGGG